ISIVQLAATVDYGILFSENYIRLRKEMSARHAIKKTINENIFSIAVPASILSRVGFIIWFTSSDTMVSSVCIRRGRWTRLALTLGYNMLSGFVLGLERRSGDP